MLLKCVVQSVYKMWCLVHRATSHGCPCPEERESAWPLLRRETRGWPPSRAAARLSTCIQPDTWFWNKQLFTKQWHLSSILSFHSYDIVQQCLLGNEVNQFLREAEEATRLTPQIQGCSEFVVFGTWSWTVFLEASCRVTVWSWLMSSMKSHHDIVRF